MCFSDFNIQDSPGLEKSEYILRVVCRRAGIDGLNIGLVYQHISAH